MYCKQSKKPLINYGRMPQYTRLLDPNMLNAVVRIIFVAFAMGHASPIILNFNNKISYTH